MVKYRIFHQSRERKNIPVLIYAVQCTAGSFLILFIFYYSSRTTGGTIMLGSTDTGQTEQSVAGQWSRPLHSGQHCLYSSGEQKLEGNWGMGIFGPLNWRMIWWPDWELVFGHRGSPGLIWYVMRSLMAAKRGLVLHLSERRVCMCVSDPARAFPPRH